jgi:hypothetical protein
MMMRGVRLYIIAQTILELFFNQLSREVLEKCRLRQHLVKEVGVQ